MKKILIIMADLLDKHSEFTTGAHYLKDHFAIEFIVCKSWIWNNHNEEIDRNYFAKTDTLFKHSFADSYDDLILQIKNAKPDYIFDISNSLINNEINELCKNLNCKHVIIRNGHFSASIFERFWLKVKKLYYNFGNITKNKINQSKNINLNNKNNSKFHISNFNKLFTFLKKKIFLHIEKGDIALVAGSEARNLISKNKKIQIINIGSNDYYNYKSTEKKHSENSKDKYILFIDTLLVDNAEDEFQGLGRFFSHEEFRDLHKKLFKHIEDKTNSPIKIAGHRRGKTLDGYQELFDGRQVIFDRTVELSKNCQAIVNSISTGVFFGVLYYKPIIFYTSKNLDLCPWAPFIYSQSRILGRKIINVEKGKMLDDDYNYVDKKKYDNFINKYIYDQNYSQNEQFPFENFIKKFK